MLHRTKKEGDENRDKWIGIGGKFEEKESPEDCLLREVKEETGLELLSWRYRGIITFVSDRWPTEYMHLFTAEKFGGRLKSSEECGKENFAGLTKKRCTTWRCGKGIESFCGCWIQKNLFSL